MAAKQMELVKASDVKAPAVQGEGATILGMIDRLIASPDVPVEKLERLFDLHQRVRADAARQAYDAAFAEMQPKLPIIDRKGKGHNSKSYGRWEDIVEQIMPVLAAHGFGISFRVKAAQNAVDVTAVLSHREGHREETGFPYPYDKSGNKTDIHAIASATSYGKRYTGSAILNVVTRGEDDDAQKAGNAPISDKQADTLLRLIKDTKSDAQQFLAIAKVGNISDINASKFDVLEGMLLAKKKKQEAPV